MNIEERAAEAVRRLKAAYPKTACTLDYNEAWKLLVSVRLAAQCTDERVNQITPILFARFPTLEALADADVDTIGEIIHPCGFWRAKARDISGCMRKLRDEFGGRVPADLDTLLTLPGVGRKSANLIMGDVFGKPAIVADTHCIRLSNRLGLVETTDPAKVEAALRPLIPPEESNDFCHRLVDHGRAVCSARTRPRCVGCCLADICPRVGVESN